MIKFLNLLALKGEIGREHKICKEVEKINFLLAGCWIGTYLVNTQKQSNQNMYCMDDILLGLTTFFDAFFLLFLLVEKFTQF